MVDGNRSWEESLESCFPGKESVSAFVHGARTNKRKSKQKSGEGEKHKPSNMPNPLLNTGTSAMLVGLTFCTSNEAPIGVTPATPVFSVVKKRPSASTARNSEISWTSALVSLGDALAERSCESFAIRQGWVETYTLGREDMIGYLGEIEE